MVGSPKGRQVVTEIVPLSELAPITTGLGMLVLLVLIAMKIVRTKNEK